MFDCVISQMDLHDSPPPPPVKTISMNPAELTVLGCMVARVDLATLVNVSNPSGPVTFQMIGHSGSGELKLSGSMLSYCTSFERGPITISYRAICGAETAEGTVVVRIESPIIESELLEEIDRASDALVALPPPTNQERYYNGNFTMVSLREVICCTHDIKYWNKFKAIFDKFRSVHTVTYLPNTRGQSVSPNDHLPELGPWTHFGASGEYLRPNFVLSWKHALQWGYAVLWLLSDTICGNKCGFPQSEVDWAIEAYRWVHRNIIEYHLAIWSAQGANFETFYIDAAIAHTVTNGATTGYWSSPISVALPALCLDRHIGECLGEPRDGALWNVIDGSSNPYWRELEWYDAWVDQIEFDSDGCILWDCGSDVANLPHNMWGCGGENKCPSSGHVFRYIHMAQIVSELGKRDASVINGFAKTFAKRICLPLDYVMQSGTFEGQMPGTQMLANFIDGSNDPFRQCFVPGYQDANGAFDSMNGFAYFGWGWSGIYDDDAKDCLTRIYHETGQPASGLTRTGTWQRNNGTFANLGKPAYMLSIKHRRGHLNP